MAPKSKSRLVDQPPSASSSEEQEQVEESQEEEEEEESREEEREEESEEETEEEEEEEPKTAPPVEKRPITQKPVQTPQKPQPSSESGSEDGSGSESESESAHSLPSPSASDFTVKPSVPAKAAAPSKPAAKRPQETQKEKDSRRKKPKIVEEEEKKAAATPRSLWSDEDQLALLKGMAEYKAQKGMEPNADMSAFHEFIKGKLHVEVSKSQLSDKLRRLKKKFLTHVKDGEDPVFSKGQDFLVFEHSKRIWGAPGTSNGVKENVDNSTNGKAKKPVEVKKSSEPKKSAKVSKPKDDEKRKEEEKQVAVKEVVKEDTVKGDQQDFHSKYPRLAASIESMSGMSTLHPNGASFLKEKMSLIAGDKAKVLEDKWKKLEDDEAALMVKRLYLIAEHYRLVVDAMRGN